ncbi:ABC transporter ATP-binding protein [Hippea alviniae]|uniref:ABC transporter ATP-binding protein n=1 Tax=Hippea alviniae TaxID=1279027 RepID=UPI0003B5C808|nr:ABC transporter ATP-binding protein [Hippea alviniae]
MVSFEKVLKVDSITQMFGGLKAIDNVSFYAKKGEIFGIVGPNGAGKTTLFNIISGTIKPTAGKIIFKDKDITKLKAFQRAKIGIARTFQVVRPFSSLSVFDNVAVAYGFRFYDKPFGKFLLRKNRKITEKIEEILKNTGLEDLKDRIAGELPLGYQRRLEIARALALNPEVILLDESFSGLSFSEMDEIKRLVLNLNSQGMTIIIIEHHMPVIMDLSKRVMVINYGKKIAEGKPEEIVNNKEVIEAYLGKSYAKG